MKKTTEVSIMGHKFTIRSDSDEEYINKVARYVDQKIEEVVQNTKSVASLNVAILAAMNIADEFFKYQKDRTNRLETVENKIKNLIELIDIQL